MRWPASARLQRYLDASAVEEAWVNSSLPLATSTFSNYSLRPILKARGAVKRR